MKKSYEQIKVMTKNEALDKIRKELPLIKKEMQLVDEEAKELVHKHELEEAQDQLNEKTGGL